jgi:hypothetical protein
MTEARRNFLPRTTLRCLAASLIAFGSFASKESAAGNYGERYHYIANLGGDFAAAREVGFNLADISSPSLLDSLPAGMRGVLWIGNGYNTQCAWALSDDAVAAAVAAVRGHPNFSEIYYISDEPHPANCPDAAHKVAERTALIHSLDSAGRTFILVENGLHAYTEFDQLAGSADFIGVDPYPCNRQNVKKGCDLSAMRRRIETALAAGIAPDRIVPVYQAFGQNCTESSSPYYRLPSVAETKAMLSVWDELVPPDRRPFDMTYSWGPQLRSACPSLKMADGRDHPDLRSVFADYFAEAQAPKAAHD